MMRLSPRLAPLCLWSVTIAALVSQASDRLVAQTPAPGTYLPAANVCVLCDLGGAPGNARWPKEIGLMVRRGDFLYTTTPSGGTSGDSGALIRVAIKTGALEVLHSFGLDERGANPLGGLVDAGDGTYRGTTYVGGFYPITAAGQRRLGKGTVFSYTPGQQPQTLHAFRNGDLAGIVPELCPPKRPCQYSPQQRLNAALSYPMSAPVKASNGVFYGVTSYSGNQKYGGFYKVVPYKGESGITALCINGPMPTEPDLTNAQLLDRCLFNITNGSHAVSLTAGPAGELFGVTLGAGTANLYGTLFAATLDGRVTTLHRFDGVRGSKPYSVMVASDGALYGTTLDGGTLASGRPGFGVIWRMSGRGKGFEVLHTFTGLSDGAGPISGLIEKIDPNGARQFYGATRGGGQTRGVLYRISEFGAFQVLHQHPYSWTATGALPSTTLLEVDGAFYGTTYQGGAHGGGTVFRMTDVELPDVRQLATKPTFTIGKLEASATVAWPGQTAPISIRAYSGAKAGQPTPVAGITDNGFLLRVANCRNPHILQFIYREKIDANGVASTDLYSTSNGESYPLTDVKARINWHTDGGAGRPNPFYDQGGQSATGGANARIVTPTSIDIFDQPNFGKPQFVAGAAETWRATFDSLVICNCRVVRVVKWAREVVWDPVRGQQLPVRYTPMSIVVPTEQDIAAAEAQLVADRYAPFTFLRMPGP